MPLSLCHDDADDFYEPKVGHPLDKGVNGQGGVCVAKFTDGGGKEVKGAEGVMRLPSVKVSMLVKANAKTRAGQNYRGSQLTRFVASLAWLDLFQFCHKLSKHLSSVC